LRIHKIIKKNVEKLNGTMSSERISLSNNVGLCAVYVCVVLSFCSVYTILCYFNKQNVQNIFGAAPKFFQRNSNFFFVRVEHVDCAISVRVELVVVVAT
jgi:hypothetical protein